MAETERVILSTHRRSLRDRRDGGVVRGRAAPREDLRQLRVAQDLRVRLAFSAPLCRKMLAFSYSSSEKWRIQTHPYRTRRMVRRAGNTAAR